MNHLRSQIQGHEIQISKLEKAISEKHLPHAMLFVGPESIGKKMVAFALAQKLLCEVSGQNACGVCPSCIRVAKHQSENLMYIEPSGQNIKIDQTRLIMDFLSLANFGRNRIVIIDQAHLLNLQAANSILKILEEPSDNVFFILISPEAESVLSTIRSRSQVFRFSNLSESIMKKIKPGLEDWVYKCSRGQINALTFLSSSDGLEKRTQSFNLLDTFWNDVNFLNLTTWRSFFKDREEAQSILKNWVLIMRDVLVFKMNQEEFIFNKDQIEKIKKLNFLDNLKINSFISQLLRIEKDIQGYVDSTLLIESLWVQNARK